MTDTETTNPMSVRLRAVAISGMGCKVTLTAEEANLLADTYESLEKISKQQGQYDEAMEKFHSAITALEDSKIKNDKQRAWMMELEAGAVAFLCAVMFWAASTTALNLLFGVPLP